MLQQKELGTILLILLDCQLIELNFSFGLAKKMTLTSSIGKVTKCYVYISNWLRELLRELRELFSCHVNIDGSISDTFPKTNAFIRWYYCNDASESPKLHFFGFQIKLVSQFASTGGFK